MSRDNAQDCSIQKRKLSFSPVFPCCQIFYRKADRHNKKAACDSQHTVWELQSRNKLPQQSITFGKPVPGKVDRRHPHGQQAESQHCLSGFSGNSLKIFLLSNRFPPRFSDDRQKEYDQHQSQRQPQTDSIPGFPHHAAPGFSCSILSARRKRVKELWYIHSPGLNLFIRRPALCHCEVHAEHIVQKRHQIPEIQ